MNIPKPVSKRELPRIAFVPRPGSQNAHRIKPIDLGEQILTTAGINPTISDRPQSISPRYVSVDPSTLRSANDSIEDILVDELPPSTIGKSPLSVTQPKRSSEKSKKTNQVTSTFLSQYTTKQILIAGLIIGAAVVLVALTITIPIVYVYVIRQNPSVSSSTNITVSSCFASTCIGKETPYRTSIITALYAFDGNTNDQTGYSSGTTFGLSAVFYTIGGYVSQAIFLTANQQQYVQIPNIDFSSSSFTIQAWIFTPTITNMTEFGIFGQCDANSMCLALSLRTARFVFAFDSMSTTKTTLMGSTAINTNYWYHITIVYDATLFQQLMYVNGVLDALSGGITTPYQGISSSSTTTIGRCSFSGSGTTYYTGRIDQVVISAGVARSACQILSDASLVVYYPFNTNATYNDYGTNICNGIASGVTTVSTGRVNQALSFTSNTSFFQSQCFPKMTSGSSFSYSLWVKPSSNTGGSLVHISSLTNGNSSCFDALVLTSNGSIVCQWMTNSNSINSIQGPQIPVDTWTHIAAVLNTQNGARLYINGQLSAATFSVSSISIQDPNIAVYMTLGNIGSLGSLSSIVCSNGPSPILSGSFRGMIDEFRLYNRELSNQEICVLANP